MTTFAVVVGAVGSKLYIPIILTLGFANLLTDRFSISIVTYLGAKSEKDNYQEHYYLVF
ncbi:VIT1/CCC1 transporter family protein [bacterium]|nr:VIT1/CCC1 transporter family protein [bacterium]